MDIQPVVVGTAGHIDHGKSSLVRALTGIDPDRLKEERERGMTIDLGFANFALSDGRRVGIVDVPGHERFLRNMVAGASGVDLVVLVVAADDGVMPQTVEHLAVLQLLGLQRGLVALTKVDMVEEELVELATEDVRGLLAGTFLEQAPIFPVSSTTGEGLDAFRAELERLAAATPPRSAEGVFRMPVQRIFSKAGFGTVVTGIPVSGSARPGDVLEVLPSGGRARVRGVQAYGGGVEIARAGHSSALNVADLERGTVQRGHVLATPGYFRAVGMVAVRLHALEDLPRPIPDRTRVRLHTGTADPAGQLVLLDAQELAPGETALCQVRLDDPVVVAAGDRYVLRALSPERTLGGGAILEESRYRLKRGKSFVIDELTRQERSLDDPSEFLHSVIARSRKKPIHLSELAVEAKLAESEVDAWVKGLVQAGSVVRGGKGSELFSRDALGDGLEAIATASEAWFGEHVARVQVPRLELERRSGLTPEAFAFCLAFAIEDGQFDALPGGELRPKGRGEEADPEADEIYARLDGGAFQPPSPVDLGAALGGEAKARALLDRLVDLGRAVRVSPALYFSDAAFERAQSAVAANCQRNSELVVPELRDELQTSRKYLIPLLEHMDAIGFTMRQGGHRVLRRR